MSENKEDMLICSQDKSNSICDNIIKKQEERVTYSEDQIIALDGLVEKWRNMKSGIDKSKFTSLSGFAGMGKTFIMSPFAKRLYQEGESIAFCALCGKAVSVLKNKLIKADALSSKSDVSTIHSLIYRPIVNSKGKITGWKRRDKLEFGTIIIDEGSMVNKPIFKDLLKYHVVIIVIGDAGQLEAIGEQIDLVKDADFKLTTIHRQALESAIIKLSLNVRLNGKIDRGKYSKDVLKVSNIFDPIVPKLIDRFALNCANNFNSIILCGMHFTRVKLNNIVRRKLEYSGKIPMIGEKVICQKNNKDSEIFNGMQGRVKEIIRKDDNFIEMNVILDEPGERVYRTYAPIQLFGLAKYDDVDEFINTDEFKQNAKNFGIDLGEEKIDQWDFGYALTVHRAQGSEFKNVLLIEERNKFQSDENWKKWLYTAVTRSSKKLAIIEDFQW